MTNNKKKSALSQKRYSFSLSVKEVVGWLTLLVFISGWFFVLGIVVGRWYVPVPVHEDTLQESLLTARRQALDHPDRPTRPVAPKAAALQDDGDNSPITASEPKPEQTKRPSVTRDISGKTSPAEKDPPPARPSSVETAVRPPEAKAEEAAFTIQVAALRDRKTADQLMQTLRKKDFPAYVTEARLPDDNIWFRVRCGKFADRQAAAPVIEALREDGYSPLLVRQ